MPRSRLLCLFSHRWGELAYRQPHQCDRDSFCQRCGRSYHEVTGLDLHWNRQHQPDKWEDVAGSCEQRATCLRCGQRLRRGDEHAWIYRGSHYHPTTERRRCARCGAREYFRVATEPAGDSDGRSEEGWKACPADYWMHLELTDQSSVDAKPDVYRPGEEEPALWRILLPYGLFVMLNTATLGAVVLSLAGLISRPTFSSSADDLMLLGWIVAINSAALWLFDAIEITGLPATTVKWLKVALLGGILAIGLGAMRTRSHPPATGKAGLPLPNATPSAREHQ